MSASVELAQKRDRYRNRRRMAWLSFVCITVSFAALIAFGLSSDARAERISSLSFLLGSAYGLWTTIILAYYGVTTINDNTEIRISSRGDYERRDSTLVKEPFIPEAPDPYA